MNRCFFVCYTSFECYDICYIRMSVCTYVYLKERYWKAYKVIRVFLVESFSCRNVPSVYERTMRVYIQLVFPISSARSSDRALNKRLNIQRRLAWSLCKDDTHNRREANPFFFFHSSPKLPYPPLKRTNPPTFVRVYHLIDKSFIYSLHTYVCMVR